MDEKLIDQLYSRATSLGYKKSKDEFASLVKTDNEVFNDMFSFAQSKGLVSDETQFGSMVGKFQAPYKKKDESTMVGLPEQIIQTKPQPKPEPQLRVSETPVPKGEQRLQAVQRAATELPSEDGLLVSAETEQPLKPRVGVVTESTAVPKVDVKAIQKQKAYEGRIKDETPKEIPYFGGTTRTVLDAIDSEYSPIGSVGIGDFIDDMGRAIASGLNQGAITTPANILLLTGKNASPEQIKKYIEASKDYEKIGASEEMIQFSKTYQEEGSSIYGLLKGLAENPGVIGELIVSSATAMINPSSLSAAGAVTGGFAASGAISGGAVGAGAGALSSVPWAIGAAGTALETGLTFSELLNDKLKERNLEFTEENVKEILQDENLVSEIRTKSLARGATIGAIDALTGRLAGKVGAKLVGNTAASKVKAGLASSGIEMAGGSFGEAAGRVVAGQPLDVAEIGLEGISEGPMAIADVTAEVLRRPIYKVNGERRSESDIETIINTASPEDLYNIDIDIKNDVKGYRKKIQDIIVDDQMRKEIRQANPNVDDTTVNTLLGLEKELKTFENNKTQSGKDRAASIRSQIKTIQQDAVQEQAAGEVPVQPTTGVSQQVAQGKPQAGPQVAAEEGVTAPLTEEKVITLQTITGTPEGGPRLRAVEDMTESEKTLESDAEAIAAEMNQMSAEEINFTEPDVSQKGLEVDPISESKSIVKPVVTAVKGLLKKIQDFNGIPMLMGMSDMLAAGKIKDSAGNEMDVEGGLLFNVLGKNKNAAWAGVTQEAAQTQYDNAVKLYNNNKDLFDRLWAEGRLPDGHIPMAIMRMADTAVNSNEATFRWVLPTVESLPEENRKSGMNAFISSMQEKLNTKESAKAQKVLDFIKSKNITTLDQFFKDIVADANARAKSPTQSSLNLDDRGYIYDAIFAPSGIKKASKPTVKALFNGVENPNTSVFLSDTVYDAIGEPSMRRMKQGEVASVVGIDVKNGGVVAVEHGNYGYGPKGQTIALISNPKHGMDVFPEFRAKASRVFKENVKGEMPSPEAVAQQTGGAFFTDKAFQGAKAMADAISDLSLLIGKLRFAFPSVSVSTTKEEFDNVVSQPDVRTRVSDGKVILGVTKDGKIYLNPDMVSLKTPIHEFGHIWIDFLRSEDSGKKGTDLLNRGLSLVRNTEEHKKAMEKYGDTDLALEEALVELMANKGATIVDAAKKSEFKSWMNAVFKYIKEKFSTFKDLDRKKISEMSLDEFINTGLADLFSGKAVVEKFEPSKVKEAQAPRMSQESKPVSELTGYDKLLKDVTDTLIPNAIKRKLTGEEMINLVKRFVSKQDIYKVADDIQRDELVRQVNGMLGEAYKNAPSAQKILGIKKTKVQVSDELKALNDQLKLEAKAAREAKADLNTKRKQLTDSVRKMAEGGKIGAKKVAALINKIGKLNLDSRVAVNKFIDYASKVFADADYSDKLNTANSTRKKIRKISKNADKSANLRTLGRKFAEIDPSMVEDIDEYNEIAKSILESVKGSTMRGTDIKFANIVSEADVIDYINNTLEEQKKKIFDEKVESIKELFGIDASNLTQEQLNELVDLISGKEEVTKYDNATIRDTIQKAFDIYSTLIKDMLSTGKDPFTDEDVEFTESQMKTIRDFMGMNLDLLDARESLDAVDGLVNFIQNKSTAKMEAVVRKYTGEKNARELAKKGVKSSKLKKYWSPAIGKFLAEQTTNLNILFEKMFKGFNVGGMVERMMGVADLKNGKSKGQSEANRIVNDYVKQFYDKKANGEAFNTGANAIERGMASFMTRNIVGTESEMKAEFDRRKGLIEQSIEALSQGNEDEVAKSKLYQDVYDKILADSNTIEEVSDKVDPVNMEAVNFWREQWASKYDQLSDVSLNVYNKVLDKDINYVPDRFTKLSSDTGTVELSTDDMAFHANNGTIYQRETGVLMNATRPDNLPINPKSKDTSMYIDLSFDKNNSNAMYDALVDINTAGAIRQIEAFMNSSSFKKIVPQSEDAKILKDRINLFVRNIRNKNPYDNDELSSAVRKLNRIATIGVGQALGGVLQPIKQVIPVAMNTLINGGGLDLGAVFNSAKNNFISNSGYAIANRGIESQAQVESLNKLIDEAAKSKGEKAIQLIEEANKKWLQIFLVKPDVFIARASWMTYYEQALKKQDIDPKTIDYNTHQLNEEAADYAQRMVDRQQNVSDSDLAGKLLSDNEPTKQVFIKMLMPFASFRMNQSSRLGSDLGTLMSKTSTQEDKKVAARSLAGFGVEMATFKIVSAGAAVLMYNIVSSLMGTDDDEEKRKKATDAILKGQLTSTVTDIFSPLPLTDKIVQAGAAAGIDKVQDVMGVAEDDKLSIYSGTKEDFIKSLGLFGIAADRASQLYEVSDLAFNGTYTDEYGREKTISKKNQETLKYLIGPALLTNIGLAPTEVNTIVRGAVREAKRSSKTEEQRKKQLMNFLLQGYENKSEMKRYDPELYESVFGEDGMDKFLFPKDILKAEIKKELNKIEREIKDEIFEYTPKKKNKDDMFGGDRFGGEEETKKKKKKTGFGGSKKFGE
jgi:hypothetical protein